MQPNRLDAMRQTFEKEAKDVRDLNPWKIETEGWSFSAQKVSLTGPTRKRGRVFTGQINVNRSGLPANIRSQAQAIRIGIAIFLAADIFLVAMLVRAIL